MPAGTPVAAAVVYVATEMAGPGWVRHHGRGELVIAPCSDSETLLRVLAGAASDDFLAFAAGLNRVQQQRAVYAALKGKMDGAQGELHALALTTKAPE